MNDKDNCFSNSRIDINLGSSERDEHLSEKSNKKSNINNHHNVERDVNDIDTGREDAGRNKCNIFIANVYCFGQQRRTFCYRINEKAIDKIGSIVEINFSKRVLIGIILSIEKADVENDRIKTRSHDFSISRLKDINKILYANLLSEKFISFLQKMIYEN